MNQQKPRPEDVAAEEDTPAAPDVSSDRVEPPKKAKKPPLGIAEIEELEDDAKGG